jgi:hypothetical protein
MELALKLSMPKELLNKSSQNSLKIPTQRVLSLQSRSSILLQFPITSKRSSKEEKN